MGTLFNRRCSLKIGNRVIADARSSKSIEEMLRISFKIEKTLEPEANKAEILVTNLSSESRASITVIDAIPVILEVGYGEDIFTLFKGGMYYATSQRIGTEWNTKFNLKDGGKKIKEKRINESIKPGADITEIIRKAAKELALEFGNLQQGLDNMRADKRISPPKGTTMVGRAYDEFQKQIKKVGLTASVQDEALQVLALGAAVTGPRIKLNATSGMIGSPERGEKKLISVNDKPEKRNTVKARSLILPGLNPGHAVDIESINKDVTGTFLIEKVTYVGDTFGQDWYADIEGLELLL